MHGVGPVDQGGPAQSVPAHLMKPNSFLVWTMRPSRRSAPGGGSSAALGSGVPGLTPSLPPCTQTGRHWGWLRARLAPCGPTAQPSIVHCDPTLLQLHATGGTSSGPFRPVSPSSPTQAPPTHLHPHQPDVHRLAGQGGRAVRDLKLHGVVLQHCRLAGCGVVGKSGNLSEGHPPPRLLPLLLATQAASQVMPLGCRAVHPAKE